MKLIVQPDDGLGKVISAVRRAHTSIDVGIYRLDQPVVARALCAAAARGVSVRALIAHREHGSETCLRRLERDLRALGASVRRTEDELGRYHASVMVVDRAKLYVLGFDATEQDVRASRCFGISTRRPRLVQQALSVFEADTQGLPYAPGHSALVLSPVNARRRLAGFLRGAVRELLIYDPRLADGRAHVRRRWARRHRPPARGGRRARRLRALAERLR